MNLEDILRNKRRAIFDKTMWMLVSVSVVMMIIAQFILRTINDDVCTIIFSIAASILASVIVSTFTQKYNVNGIDDEIIERFDVLKIYQNYSLRGIYTGFPFENKKYREDFINSKRVVIVMNDAKSFISGNPALFTERISQKGKTTTFIIEDYKQTDIISALNRKNGHEKGYYERKIHDVVGYDIMHLYEEAKKSKHNVQLFLNHNTNTLGIVLTDNYAMESIYRVSEGKTMVPHFIFQVGGEEYIEVQKDVDKLIRGTDNSTEIVDLEQFKSDN